MDSATSNEKLLKTLPTDDIRAIMWRFADRFDLQMLVQSVRNAARTSVAKAVSNGERNTHEWTEGKQALLKVFDDSGITAMFMDPEHGGFLEGPKNFALALAAFELAWVDGGSATCSLAGNLALEPIHERGTKTQRDYYMSMAVPPKDGENRKQLRGAFGLTEPLPFVGVETGILSGKVRVDKWDGRIEPQLKVEKRGRFITNMDFANFACVAVESDDPKIKGSMMIILEETDEGTFDRGAVTKKLVHQLSSTRDPIFNMKVPANRIIGGYTIQDGVIVPNYSHSEVIEAVFKRTRVTVGLMTAAKLISAVEPIIRYQRGRFRGGDLEATSPRYQLGIQQKEDPILRLANIWATGEASSSLGFYAARVFDDLIPLENEKTKIFTEKNIKGGRAELKAILEIQKNAAEYLTLKNNATNNDRYETLKNDPLVKYALLDSVANVLCPACKLWNTGYGANVMRDAVSLMGGYGITEDCPGFIGQKWMDAQLEATYEGPEAVQRRQLSITMTNDLFLEILKDWIIELDQISAKYSSIGANIIRDSLNLWLTSVRELLVARTAKGLKVYSSSSQGISFPLADALSGLLAARSFILDIVELDSKGRENPNVNSELESFTGFFTDLSYIQASKMALDNIKVLSEIIFGIEAMKGYTETFIKERHKVETNLKDLHDSKQRVGLSIQAVMIPEVLDYPQ